MKKLIIILFLVPLFANAQVTSHTVAAKETLYSLAREFKIHPRELAEYNHISVQSSLSVGQVIKIPATRKMAPLPDLAPAKVEEKKVVKDEIPAKKEPIKPVGSIIKDEATGKPIGITESITPTGGKTPIYHTVAPKETLYHISTLYNKVPIADLKKWNNLTGDGVKEGTNLIVGYTNSKSAPVVNETAEVKPTNTVTKKAEPVVKDEVPVKKAAPVAVAEDNSKTNMANPVTGKNFNGGFFRSFYNDKPQKKEETGKAGIFKSTSGWEDGKYYCLHNTAAAGSIVKITNPANNKVVYAKVLDVIPDLKQNAGLMLRLSNAAADELGAGADNFDCTIQY